MTQVEPLPFKDDVALMRKEFPGYDGEVLNLSPLKLEAHHNDACPAYRSGHYDFAYEITLWADFADPAKRELSNPQFVVIVRRLGDGHTLGIVATETLEELRAVLNDTHVNNVGYKPDEDKWYPLGKLIDFVMGWYIENDMASNED